jgi:hypothetical protein
VFTFSPNTVANNNGDQSPKSPFSTPLATTQPAYAATPPTGTPLATTGGHTHGTPSTPIDPNRRPVPSTSTPQEPVPVGAHHARVPSVDQRTLPVTIPSTTTGTGPITPTRRASTSHVADTLGKSPPAPIRTAREAAGGPVRTGGAAPYKVISGKKAYLSLPRPMTAAEMAAQARLGQSPSSVRSPPSTTDAMTSKSPSHGRFTPRLGSLPRASPPNSSTTGATPRAVEASSTSVGFSPSGATSPPIQSPAVPPSPNRSGLAAAMESHQSKLEEELKQLRVLHAQSSAAVEQYKLQLAELQKERAQADDELRHVTAQLAVATQAVTSANIAAAAANDKAVAIEKAAAAAAVAAAATAAASIPPVTSKPAKSGKKEKDSTAVAALKAEVQALTTRVALLSGELTTERISVAKLQSDVRSQTALLTSSESKLRDQHGEHDQKMMALTKRLNDMMEEKDDALRAIRTHERIATATDAEWRNKDADAQKIMTSLRLQTEQAEARAIAAATALQTTVAASTQGALVTISSSGSSVGGRGSSTGTLTPVSPSSAKVRFVEWLTFGAGVGVSSCTTLLIMVVALMRSQRLRRYLRLSPLLVQVVAQAATTLAAAAPLVPLTTSTTTLMPLSRV